MIGSMTDDKKSVLLESSIDPQDLGNFLTRKCFRLAIDIHLSMVRDCFIDVYEKSINNETSLPCYRTLSYEARYRNYVKSTQKSNSGQSYNSRDLAVAKGTDPIQFVAWDSHNRSTAGPTLISESTKRYGEVNGQMMTVHTDGVDLAVTQTALALFNSLVRQTVDASLTRDRRFSYQIKTFKYDQRTFSEKKTIVRNKENFFDRFMCVPQFRTVTYQEVPTS